MSWNRVLVCWLSLTVVAVAGLGQSVPLAIVDGSAPPSETPLPGVELAQTITTTTGIAISPLFGASAVGAWWYFRTEPLQRSNLPWFSSPWFWGPGLLLVLLLVLKDPLLGLIPGAKKVFDAFDVIENKASAIAVAPALVPMFVRSFGNVAFHGEQAASAEGTLSLAGFSFGGLLGLLPSPVVVVLSSIFFLATFFCVWMAFHAINVLILLSPFGVLDLLLRSLKLAVLGTLAVATLIHPYAGMAVALLIIAISIPVAGWSFRLTVFGTTLAWDLISMRHIRLKKVEEEIRGFATGALPGPPARTCGIVMRSGDRYVFSYRPFLVFPRRSVDLPEKLVLGKGLLCPVLIGGIAGDVAKVVRLPPRYRGHEEQLARVFEFEAIQELPLLRGFRAFSGWLKEIAGKGREAAFGPSGSKALSQSLNH